jgi:hypothetical protein
MSVSSQDSHPEPARRWAQRRSYLVIAVVGTLLVAAALWLFDSEDRLWQMATGFRQSEEPAVSTPGAAGGSRDRAFEHRAVEPK